MGLIKKRNLHKLVLIFAFITSLLSGCGSAISTKSASTQSMPSGNSAKAIVNNGSTEGLNHSSAIDSANTESQSPETKQSQTSTVSPNSKIIQNGAIDMETKSFTSTVSRVMDKASECGGYVESSNITGTSVNSQGTSQNRSASLKLRIPQKYFTQFMTDAGQIGNVIHSSTSSENVTYQYYDTEAHVKALTTEEDRLLDLLNKTGELKDILELEKELANVRYQIESLTGTLKKLDNLVYYSTIDVNINEVQEVQLVKKAPVSLWDKISEGFIGSLKLMASIFKGILIAAAYALPFIVLAFGLFIIVIRSGLIKRFKKNNSSGNDSNNK